MPLGIRLPFELETATSYTDGFQQFTGVMCIPRRRTARQRQRFLLVVALEKRLCLLLGKAFDWSVKYPKQTLRRLRQ